MTRLMAIWLFAAITQAAPGSSVLVLSENPFQIAIETLTIDAYGNVAVRPAQRALAPPFSFRFVPADRTFVRFSADGVSPRTYSTQELAAMKTLDLTSVDPGGELFLLIPQAAVRPTEVSVEGLRGRSAGVTDAEHLSVRGLAEGEYRVVPIYHGNIRGRGLPATVRRGASAVVLLPSESRGEAHLQVAPEYCNRGAQLHLQALGSAQELLRPITSCNTRLGGLQPGPYRVTLRDAALSVGPVPFSISPQKIETVAFPSPSVLVSGRVTVNGRSIEGAIVTYFADGNNAVNGVRRVEVQTDSSGSYQAVLNRPGVYRYQVSHPRAGLAIRGQMMVREGTNSQDIALTGGSVRIAIDGLRDRSRVSLRLEDERGRHFGSYDVSWQKGSSWQPVFEAVPLGRYRLTARAYGLRPAEIAVELTSSAPDIDVSVAMKTGK